MQTTTTTQTLNQLVAQCKKTHKFVQLEKWCNTGDYRALPYATRNFPFITASKLKAFEKCQLGYKYEYVDLVPKPEGLEDRDYFIVGRAIDDLLTYGENYYSENYVVMDSRVADVDAKIEELKEKILEAKQKINKDGTRSAVGVNQEIACLEKIRELDSLRGKMQITETMSKLVAQMKAEFEAQGLFNHKPKKRIFFHEYDGFILKAELDDYVAGDVINDIKSASNVTTVDPEMYELQASFYHWLVEENTGERLPVRLEIVDKYAYFSRSRVIEYSQSTLLGCRSRIVRLLSELREAHDSGLYIPTQDQKELYNSPYYGFNGYGRPKQIEIY